MERIDTGAGFGVLDGASLVMEGPPSPRFIFSVSDDGKTSSGAGWFMVGITFTWVAMTAAGPFFFLERRYVRRIPDYPKIGDRLWALLGIPWLATALVQSASPGSEPRHNPLFANTLSVGLAVVCLIALVVVWSTWVMVPPGRAAQVEAAPWTNRVGLILAIAWPIQCGLGLVVLS